MLPNRPAFDRTRVGRGAKQVQENKASVAEAAHKLDVSERSVRSAKKVKDKAPELVETVKAGDIDVKTAATHERMVRYLREYLTGRGIID